MKHEWRKKEKQFYLPHAKPETIGVPSFNFIMINGKGSPENPIFGEYISVLYSLSYGIKMTLKKQNSKPSKYVDYTVYPLEGIWDISEEAKIHKPTTFNKNDFVYTLMIRQPNFINEEIFNKVFDIVKKKKPNPLLDKAYFQRFAEGKCIQMLHVGRYDEEPASFKIMEDFAIDVGLKRKEKSHREIYLSDFRKVAPEKLKTVLRFQVQEST